MAEIKRTRDMKREPLSIGSFATVQRGMGKGAVVVIRQINSNGSLGTRIMVEDIVTNDQYEINPRDTLLLRVE